MARPFSRVERQVRGHVTSATLRPLVGRDVRQFSLMWTQAERSVRMDVRLKADGDSAKRGDLGGGWFSAPCFLYCLNSHNQCVLSVQANEM